MFQQFFLDLQANGYLSEKTEEQFCSVKSDRCLPDRYVEGICYLCGFEKARGDDCPSCGKYLDAKLLKKPVSTLDGTEPVLREHQALVPGPGQGTRHLARGGVRESVCNFELKAIR